MTGFSRVVAVGAAATMLFAVATSQAVAKPSKEADPMIVVASTTTDPALLDEAAAIIGGTTQSVDPTRFDYVPPESSGDGTMTPMGADGYAWFGGFTFTYKGLIIGVPALEMRHVINGSGLTISSEYATYQPTVLQGLQLCNYQTHFQNRNGNTIYSTYKSTYHEGCEWFTISRQDSPVSQIVKTGQQCARLYVAGTFRGEQCHYTYP